MRSSACDIALMLLGSLTMRHELSSSSRRRGERSKGWSKTRYQRRVVMKNRTAVAGEEAVDIVVQNVGEKDVMENDKVAGSCCESESLENGVHGTDVRVCTDEVVVE